ncbi:MurR/RpiR family transcriptional regulator [Lachnospiraceae bacterium 54-53]
MTIIEKLTKKENFTDTEEKIADYILENLSQIPDMYVQNLAKKVYSSHSAVIRLAKKLGFSGFREFKIQLVREIQDKLYFKNKVDPNFPFNPYDDPLDIAKKIADLSIESIQNTLNGLSRDKINTSVDILLNADRIFLFGTGDSQIRARSFQNKFNKIDKYVIIAGEYGEDMWNTMNMTKKDCAVFISYTGRVSAYEKILLFLKKRNIKTIILTGNPESNLLKLCCTYFEVPKGEYNYVKVGTFASQISFEYILDTLFSVIYAKKYAENLVDLKNKEFNLNQELLADAPNRA